MTDDDRPHDLDSLEDLMPPALLAAFESEMCDRCGSTDTWWRSCKLLCRACGGIVKSCADL
jgi:hypothetical protein